jgi:MFS family permease
VRHRIPLLRELPPEVAVLTAVAFCVALGFGILAPAIPIFARSFGVSAFAATAVISAFALMRFISAPFAGWLTSRIGERTTIAAGLIIVAVSSIFAGFASDYSNLIVLRAVGGVGSSMFTVAAQALILRVVDASLRGRASAAYQGGFLIGGVAGPAVGGLVLAISLRAPFFVYAASLGLGAIVCIIFLHPRRMARLNTSTEPEISVTKSGLPELKIALRNRAYIAALAANLAGGLVSFGLRAALVPLFIIEGLHQSAGLSGAAFLVAAGAQAVLLLPAGRWTDTRGRRIVMIAGTSITALAMLALTLSDLLSNDPSHNSVFGVVMLFVAMAISGFGSAFLGPAPSAVVGDVIGNSRGGLVVSLFQMMSDLGIVIGPLLGGLLVDAFDFEWAFAMGLVIMVIALILALVMPETLRRRVSVTE